MKDSKKTNFLSHIVAGGFFAICFLYYTLFDRYLIAYQEQIQLFRYDSHYFADFLATPGGLSDYIGAFFIQFFINPLAGALILTLSVAAVFTLSGFIFKKYSVSGILWSLLPAIFLLALQSDYMFNFGYSVALILVLAFIAVYISIGNENIRYSFGILGWILLYPAAGGFSFVAILVCVLHEFLYYENHKWVLISAAYLILALLLPVLLRQTIYYLPFRDAWFDPKLLTLREIIKYTLILFLAYFPISLIKIKIIPLSKFKWLQPDWKWKNLLAGTIIVLLLSWGIKNWIYDPNIRLFLEIDHNVQQDKWDRVLELSSKSKISNRLTLYYTNLALYKTGHLEDRLFAYPQIGVTGLWLNREGNELSLFLGGEIFYELGNINEATRWAFDAMVANGQTPPRLLKQLILGALINGDYGVAEKYLNILDQSLFYRDWSKNYRKYVSNPDLLLKDTEIAAKRHFMIHEDFVARTNESDIYLKQLLENHPDNRMAFEYYMSSLLLNKNLNEFAANINRIKDFGYKEIPLYYEEALLMYMGYAKKNAVPQGYGIRKTTMQNFQNYAKAYAQASQSGNPRNGIESLSRSFGNTYWFYLHFINNRTSSNESSHPFN
jgi:hypothetical protein